ncbi:hypothetical protein L6272_06525 [Microgenomates group bacterium]|nr:hypothetical protein [Microgenomates group bacterium]
MVQTDIITKRIVLSEFTEGAEARPTGSHFIAIVTKGADGGQGQWDLMPQSWGYTGYSDKDDEIVVGKILQQIARQNAFQGKDSMKQALDLLAAAGEQGITLELSSSSWGQIENNTPRERVFFEDLGVGGVPRLER